MAVKIGHASIDERGKGRGGSAGDQTGREVYVRTWYDKDWTVVLRPKKAAVAEKSARACEKGCANKHIGYDMNQRNTAHTQAKAVGYDLSKIKTNCETDCSAFMTLCALSAGVDELEYAGNAPTTSTMRDAFVATGEYEALTDKKYLTSDACLKRGDILVAEGHHTAMALENGSEAKGANTTTATNVVAEPTLKMGYANIQVKKLQSNLNAIGIKDSTKSALFVDGIFGIKTKEAVKNFQKRYDLTIDGVYGPKSYAKLKAVYKAKS